jgi:polysulfide reductase-like protein
MSTSPAAQRPTLLGRARSAVTRKGLRGVRPGSEALTGAATGRRWRRQRAEQPMVPPARFTSYYGQPVINAPVWESPDIPGYLFLGGLAGASSLLAAGADMTGRGSLARTAKTAAFGAGCLSMALLIHDLGKPLRFVNMLRVFKVTSPMSVGSWLLSGYLPATGVAAASDLSGRARPLGALATGGAALLGPAVAAYTGALISDTAVPAWHEGHREMPYVFAGSGAMAAGGLGLLATPLAESAPARVLGLAGLALEATAFERMKHRMGMVSGPYHEGRGGAYVRAGQVLSVAGAAAALAGRRSRVLSALAGGALLAASAATRWGVFHAGLASAADPKYTVVPQRLRLQAREREESARRGPAEPSAVGTGHR